MTTDRQGESSSDKPKVHPIRRDVVVGDPSKDDLLQTVAVVIDRHIELCGKPPCAIVVAVVDEDGGATSNWHANGESERKGSMLAARGLFILQHDLFAFETNNSG